MEKILKTKKNKNDNIIRTCVISRANLKKEDLLRFVQKDDIYVFDEKQNISSRGVYIVKDLEVFSKFVAKYKVGLESSERVLKILEKKSVSEDKDKQILNILAALKNSDYLIYGVDDNLGGIKLKRVKMIILPSDLNSKMVNKFKKLAKIFEVKIIFISKQFDLKKVFDRDVKVIGITSKKVIKGIINKMEV